MKKFLNYFVVIVLKILPNISVVDAAVIASHDDTVLDFKVGGTIYAGKYQFPIHVLEGDKRAEHDVLIDISDKLMSLNPDALEKNAKNLSDAIDATIDVFHKYSIQAAGLKVISEMVKNVAFVPKYTRRKEAEHMAELVALASCFFRFTKPGGVVTPEYFPTDEEYILIVRSITGSGSTLHELLSFVLHKYVH